MNVLVAKDYKDKKTKALIKKGSSIELSEKRFKEINSAGHGILVEEIENEKKEKPDEKEKADDKKK